MEKAALETNISKKAAGKQESADGNNASPIEVTPEGSGEETTGLTFTGRTRGDKKRFMEGAAGHLAAIEYNYIKAKPTNMEKSTKCTESLINIASASQDDNKPAVAWGNIKEDTSKMHEREQRAEQTPATKTPAKSGPKDKVEALKVLADEEGEEEEKEDDDDDNDADDYDNDDDNDAYDYDDDDERYSAVKIGQYLIAKSDMKRLENCPTFWRITRRCNRLFTSEMIVQDKAVRHKSLYTISSQYGETLVEISQDCVPKPQDLSRLEEKHSSDQLLPAYIIYVDAMFHQAVDSSFLRKINMDNDFQHYVNAINHVDVIIRDQISNIENDVSMKDEFKSKVQNCPMMESVPRPNWSETDEATTNKSSEKGVCSIYMHGSSYDPFFMEKDIPKDWGIVIGSTMEKYFLAYHGLMHFKYTLLLRCQYKVKLTNALEPGEDVLEKCLQDRTWILETFEDLKNLLANENLIW